jgi:Protein of unknown function (DUF3176)
LCITLLSIVGCIVVIVHSDGDEIHQWPISPSVWLALLAVSANSSLQYGRHQGVPIAWWRSALHGARLDELQRNHRMAGSFVAAATAGRRTNILSLATLFGSLMTIDGVLLQRASTINQIPTKWTDVELRGTVAPEIPYGYSGFSTQLEADANGVVHQFEPQGYSKEFIRIIQQYVTRTPINTTFSGCQGNCYNAQIRAAGLSYKCTNHTMTWEDYTSNEDQNEFKVFDIEFQNIYRFKNDTSFTYQDRGTIDMQMKVTYLPEEYSGEGSTQMTHSSWSDILYPPMIIKTCNISSATVIYPINFRNNIASFNDSTYPSNSQLPVVSIQDAGDTLNTIKAFNIDDSSSAWMTLGGLTIAARFMYSGSARFTRGEDKLSKNTLMPTIFQSGGRMEDYRWKDPTTSIFDFLNEIMFRIAVDAPNLDLNFRVNKATNVTVSKQDKDSDKHSTLETYLLPLAPATPKFMPLNSTIQSSTTQALNGIVFKSRYEYLAAAVSIMLLTIAIVIPIFNGFWEIGRDVSLNPIEVAKAFDAPLLKEAGSNSTIGQLRQQVGDFKVRYGEVINLEQSGVQQGEVEQVLKFDLQEKVRRPWAGSRYN